MGWGKKRGLLLVLVTALLAGSASAQPFRLFMSNTLPDRHEEAEPPPGFPDFCVRFADQCATPPGPRTGRPTVLTLDTAMWRQLNTVNHAVNAAIKPEDDQTHYGREEYWTIPTDGRGDCEDYALTKRKDLLDAGLPASAVRIAVVYSLKTALHAVLTVSTDKGDFVLDSLTDKILLWNATDFTWIEVQDPSNPRRWDSLQPAYARTQNGSHTADAAHHPVTPSEANAPRPSQSLPTAR
jgi:predicted transglutaminase-like cysteine proteinase